MILYHFTLFCILSAPCLIGPTLISSSYLFSVSFILIAVLSTPPSDLPFADYILLLVFILPINSFILIFPHLLFFSFLFFLLSAFLSLLSAAGLPYDQKIDMWSLGCVLGG